jgi:hypothetical protein
MYKEKTPTQPRNTAPTSSFMTDRTNRENVWYTTTSSAKPSKDASNHAFSTSTGNLMAATTQVTGGGGAACQGDGDRVTVTETEKRIGLQRTLVPKRKSTHRRGK